FFRVLIRTLGYGDRSAAVGGVLLAALATLSIPATYWLVRTLTDDVPGASCGAVLLPLCPRFVIIFPTFDALFPPLTAALLITWHRAVTNRYAARFAAMFGVVLFVTCFFTYNVLVLGAFLLPWAVALIRKHQVSLNILTRAAVIAVASCLACYAILWLLTG